MSPLKIAATGLEGLVGSRIKELLQNDITFISLPQKEFDITNKDAVYRKLKPLDFDIFLHLAAYTNVDQAEIEREKAFAINVDGTQNIFEVVSDRNKPFIHISTGYVFDGTTPPYTESSIPHPIGYYAETKYLAEQIVKDKAMIVRIELPYRAIYPQKSDFVRSLLTLLKQEKDLTMIKDSLITPTFIDDIAYGLNHLFHHLDKSIYHLVGKNSLSPYEAVITIADIFNINSEHIKKTSFNEYMKGKAERPRYGEIISERNTFYPMKSFKDGIIEVKKQMESKL
jgi:dTDP-4-dehydrorhamnose reductase